MKKPGFLAATLVTACLFAFGLAAVAHYALAPGGPEVIESANAAEVGAEPAGARGAPRALAANGNTDTVTAGRSVNRAGAPVEIERSSSSRVSVSAVRRKSIAATQARYGDDDDDDDDDDYDD